MTDVYAPLYEAKMLSFFDHRAADSVRGAGSQRQTVPSYLSDAEKDDPQLEVVSLYWVSEFEVEQTISDVVTSEWLLGWADSTSATNLRSFVPCAIPRSAVGNKFPLALFADAQCAPEFLGVCSSLVFDYLVRQKLSGITLNYFIVKQFPIPSPTQLGVAAPWQSSASISDEIRDRVRELTVTSWRMVPFARDMGDVGPPFRWLPARLEQIRAELDAMMVHVYGLERDEVDYVLDTFTVMRKYDERDHGEYRTKRLILEYYDLLASSISSGVGYVTPISPVPGDGPRHDESTRPEWMPGVE
jgi:hypothetical protein